MTLPPSGPCYNMPKEKFLSFNNTEQLLTHLMHERNLTMNKWRIHFAQSQCFYNISKDSNGNPQIVPNPKWRKRLRKERQEEIGFIMHRYRDLFQKVREKCASKKT